MVFFETSAKTAEGVEDAFTKATKHILNGILGGNYDLNSSEAIGIKPGNQAPKIKNSLPLQEPKQELPK